MKLIEIADQTIEKPDKFEEQKLLGIAEAELAKDHEVFKQLGLKNNEIEDTYKAKEKAIIFNQTYKLYGRSSYTFDQLEELCMAYNLRLLQSRYFKGKVPHNIVSEIKEFSLKHDIDLSSAHSNQFYILGPEESFVLSKVERKPKDPVLLWRDGDTFIPITQWGGELTFMRYLRSIPKRTEIHKLFSNTFIALFLTILVYVAFVGFHWSIYVLPIIISGATFFMSSSVLTDMRWEGTDELWNNDRGRSAA